MNANVADQNGSGVFPSQCRAYVSSVAITVGSQMLTNACLRAYMRHISVLNVMTMKL